MSIFQKIAAALRPKPAPLTPEEAAYYLTLNIRQVPPRFLRTLKIQLEAFNLKDGDWTGKGRAHDFVTIEPIDFRGAITLRNRIRRALFKIGARRSRSMLETE